MSKHGDSLSIGGKRYDVIVVGAGPAGCSTAIFLARRGYDVLLVDRAEFPRDKTCGDGLSPRAMEVLNRMGVAEKIENSTPWRIDGVEFFSPAGQRLRTEFHHVEGIRHHGYVFPRRDLDLLLFQHLRECSRAVVLENRRVVDLLSDGGMISGVRVHSERGPMDFIGKVIVGADGVHSIVARKAFSQKANPNGTVLAVRAYFDHVQGLDHYVEVHCEKSLLSGYGWVFPTGQASANVGIGTSYRSGITKKDMMRLFDAFLRENSSMRERFKNSQIIESSMRTSFVPLGPRLSRRGHENVLLVGDAGSFADPLTGEGIYQALRSGECAAQAVAAGFDDNIARVGDIFESLWKKEFRRGEYILGYLIQRFVFGEFFLNLNIKRALKNRRMAETLVAILCHKKSKLRLLL